jgi:hypothetical protein
MIATCDCPRERQTVIAYPDGRLAMRCVCGAEADITPPPPVKTTAAVIRERWKKVQRAERLNKLVMIVGLVYGVILWALCSLVVAVTLIPLATFAGALLVLFLVGMGMAMFKAWVGKWRDMTAGRSWPLAGSKP